jgi:carbamoyl-phosphate synthase large subunit
MSDKSFKIGLTGLNAIDSPGPGVGVARCLKDSDDLEIEIIGLAYESLEPGIYLHDLIKKSYQVPYPSAGTEQVFKRLSHIQSKEHLDLIIPNFDAELWNYIKLTPRLKEIGIRTFMPSLEQLDKINKLNLDEFARNNDIPSPSTKKFSSIDELEEFGREAEYPLVIKGKFYEAYIVFNTAQLVYYYNKLNAKWGLPVLVQEFVDGSEIVIAGLGDGKGNLIGAVPLRKLFITDKGKGWAGVVINDQRYLDLAEKINKVLAWKGGFEIELKRNDNGDVFLLEINPRFPAWIYTTAAAGQNMPLALVHMAMGMEQVPFQQYETGKMFVRYSWDHITDISEFQKISTLGEL